MKKTAKQLAKLGGIVTVLVIVFSAGSYASASSDWVNGLLFDKSEELREKADEKVEELRKKSENGAKGTITEQVDELFAEKEKEVTKALEDYYDEKAAEMADSKMSDVKVQANEIESAVVDQYKEEIDKIFEE